METLEALFSRYGAMIRARLAAMDRSLTAADLDDLEQDVRIRLWQHWRREREISQPASLIKQVVLCVAVDAARRVQARGGKGSHGLLEEWHEPLADPDDLPGRAEFRQRLERVERELAGLGPEVARLVRLYLAGFTTEEMGRVLAISEAKARNAVYRALKHLQAACRNEGEDDERSGRGS